MKGRWIALGTALGFVLALTLGFASGQMSVGGSGGVGPMMDRDAMWATMDGMHESPAMQEMHDQMPADLAAQCDAMHEQMSQMMAGVSGGMSGGMGGVAGSMPGMGTNVDSATHAAHHPGGMGN